MKNKSLSICTGLACLSLLLPLSAQAAGLPPDVIASAERRIELGLNPGLVIIFKEKGQAPVIQSFGKTSFAQDAQLVTPETRFEIGSVTKTFTALQAALQIERGALKTDATLSQIWPQSWGKLNASLNPITLSELLTHSSGLPRMPDNFEPAQPTDPYLDYSAQRLQSFAHTHVLSKAPKTYAYSNLGYGILSSLLVHNSKQTNYAQMLKQDILRPLGMNQTQVDDPAAGLPLAHAHYEGVAVPGWHFSEVTQGLGALRSTGQDMARYLSAQLEPQSISDPELSKAILRSQQILYQSSSHPLNLAYAWHLDKRLQTAETPGPEYSHNGMTGGFLSHMSFAPDRGRGVVILTNNTDAIQDLAQHLMHPESPLKPLLDQRTATEKLNVYLGQYLLAPGLILKIRQEAGYLIVGLTGQAELRVFPEAEADHFVYRIVDAQLVFERNPEGNIRGVTLNQNGKSLYASKTK